MSLLSKLAEKTIVAAADWALGKLFGPPKPGRPRKRAPTELDSADVAIQNRASHVPEAHKVKTMAAPDPAEASHAAGAAMAVPPRRSSTRYDD